jgi:hypothetical protein
MGRSAREDGRPVAGPATGDALKTALKGALAAKGDGDYQGRPGVTSSPTPGAPTSSLPGTMQAATQKLLHPTANIEAGVAAGGG